MPQTVNGESRPSLKSNRPGQRQQDRLQRLARRQRRRRIITASVATALVLILGISGLLFFQNYTAQQTALANTHATATASTSAHLTATAITKNCFVNPSGPSVPAIYESGAPTPSAGPSSSPSLDGKAVTLTGGLKYVDIVTGTGATAKSGSSVSVEYTGWVASTCAKFDSSYDGSSSTPGVPFSVTLGEGQVIKGWDQGLLGIKAGGTRRLYIPSALAYGNQAEGSIPANADLIFDVTALSVK